MTYRVVTTMNAQGWTETGRRMAESFLARWPKDIPLTIYAEDFVPGIAVESRRLPAWLGAFKKAYRTIGRANGRTVRGYDFRFDAVKFAHKVAALTDFGLACSDGVMIWLDADTFTHADVTVEWIDGLLGSQPAYIAWLDRLNNYPECGFLMLRCDHRSHHTLMARFAALYQSGAVLRMRETHDSFVLQHLIHEAMRAGEIEPPVSLSGEARSWHHPFVEALGGRMDHCKGPRKQEGRSRPRDLRTPRSEPYWAGP